MTNDEIREARAYALKPYNDWTVRDWEAVRITLPLALVHIEVEARKLEDADKRIAELEQALDFATKRLQLVYLKLRDEDGDDQSTEVAVVCESLNALRAK